MSERALRVTVLHRRETVTDEVLAVVGHMAASPRFRPSVISTTRNLAAAMAPVAERGVPVLRRDGVSWTWPEEPRAAAVPPTKTLRDRVKPVLVSTAVARSAVLARGILADRAFAKSALRCTSADALIVFDDRSIRPEMVWLDVAGHAGIARVLLPFATSSIESDVLSRRGKPSYRGQGVVASLARRAAPANERTVECARLLFHDAWSILVARALGLSVGKPWVPGGGMIDAAAALGPEDLVEPLAEGVPSDRLEVTGQASLDCLRTRYEGRVKLKADLMARLRLDRTPLIVCAVPQTAEHGIATWDRHRRDTKALFQALAASGASVVLSLHPRSVRTVYQSAASKCGLVIADEPLREVLPLADLFVAGFSSTVRWAAGLGIPVVITDMPGLGYTIFGDLPGIEIAGTETHLRDAVSALVACPELRAARGESLHRASAWRMSLDGNACERIAALIERTIDAVRVRRFTPDAVGMEPARQLGRD